MQYLFRHRPLANAALQLSIAAILLPATLPAFAARPFVTDDARLTTAGSCQLESWLRVYPQSREAWALPACNPGGNLEITAGGGRARGDGEAATQDYLLQAKTLLRTLEADGFGLGFAAGRVMHPTVNPGPNLFGNTYAYVPLTLAFADGRTLIHGNLGWLREHNSRQDKLTWGIGGEYAFGQRVSAIAEVFGDNRAQAFWQTGVRVFIVPDRVQIDATLGGQNDSGPGGRWFSLGLRLTPAQMF
ncbi:hypothetical protein [Rhodocyclus tenuis]|uniref:Transporter n=1 Tax=Rhodocyclus tenuis TaxID=1066 RepID=A0A840GC52_RHOTE|nr:hypothetical protein [Rhodocyclus tenuis]MBB4248228.1 hypothetical protein [Rhodocyclus tenuis]